MLPSGASRIPSGAGVCPTFSTFDSRSFSLTCSLVRKLDAVQSVSGQGVIVEIAVFRIECDAIGCDLWWRFLLLVKQFSCVDDQLETFLWLRRRMPIE